MHVILGANGRAGGEVARTLLMRGEPVRVVVRGEAHRNAWADLGAEIVVASFEDVDAIATSFAGASGAFMYNPPPVHGDPFARTMEIGGALALAAKKARLPKAVVLSAIGAQHSSGTGVISTLHKFEEVLEGIAPALAFLRSGYFVETWGEVPRPIMVDGILPSFIEADQRIPMVSTIDVGRTGADLLLETWTGKRVVELAGTENWSPDEVAEAFATVLNRQVGAVYVPPAERHAILAADGVPTEVANVLLGMFEGISNGLFIQEQGTERRQGATSLAPAIERVVADGRWSGN